MSRPAPISTRQIAKEAVRAQLAAVGYELLRREGFENVTIDDLANAAGVSRTTFFRYFDRKEDVVLGAWDIEAGRIIDELLRRPADEEEWTSLRRALQQTVRGYAADPSGVLTLLRFIRGTPALWGGLLAKQSNWQPAAAQALAARGGSKRAPTLSDSVLVSAGIGCYTVALEHWVAADGQLDFEVTLDEAFATIGARLDAASPTPEGQQ
ncbi:TetR/AcrR family transcriptional regulator [Trujillonella endophytica]|uniref:Transcriptional regulator, TetR family n=1 Tax=Trujillonella endophytica TaxID=673521 RepID=A0A1H8RT53_9ACTN|nr:TetR family transcriptional regulator [Trujillella endophytica]SEO69641.1 transcriptional regulator, TetR family [Trujillella endophytica]